MCVEDTYPEDVEEQSTVDVEDIIRPRTPPPYFDEDEEFWSWYEERQKGILRDLFHVI